MRNCKAKRIVGPYGSWHYEELIGARVKISSMPVSNFSKGFDCGQICTIKDIVFRISNEGKTITVIILEEFPSFVFTWKDLEVIGIVVKNEKESDESGANKAKDNENDD